jgi:hypothetical protein
VFGLFIGMVAIAVTMPGDNTKVVAGSDPKEFDVSSYVVDVMKML